MTPQKARVKRSPPQHRRGRRRSRTSIAWWAGGAIVLALLVAGIWLASRGEQQSTDTRLPGPAGGREVSQEVNTLVGRQAPSFALSTADGEKHTVPRGKGRPTVIIFHMGVG
ncbi:MAG: hypothetical protein ACRDF5_01450 [bacterium]